MTCGGEHRVEYPGELDKDRYKILGYVSSAAKNGLNKMAVLRDAMQGQG